MTDALDGVLVVDKPTGPTSHDIVAEVRRLARGVRVGHTGTLDPLATGVLPLCIGRATRLARFLTASRKLYSGIIELGLVTDTDDIEGRTLARNIVPSPSVAVVRAAAARLTGSLIQTPPLYSARKTAGRPMYELARQGQHVPRRPTPVIVHRFEIHDVSGPMVHFLVETSPGTYVRSLARDLGEALGTGACLAGLRRLATGGFGVEDSHTMEEVRTRGRSALAEMVVPMRGLDLGIPTVTVNAAGVEAMRSGRAVISSAVSASAAREAAYGPIRVQDQDGNLVGVARFETNPRGDTVLLPNIVLVC